MAEEIFGKTVKLLLECLEISKFYKYNFHFTSFENRHVLKPETTGTKPPEQPERPEQESEMTGTTETKIEHDRNNVVEYDRNDSYLGLTIVPIVFDFGFGGSGHF